MRIYREFNALGEYIWKLPSFLKDEEAREERKLWAYFPLSDDPEEDARNATLRALRFEHEFSLIYGVYPKALGASCVILAVAKFEHAVLTVCRDYEEVSKIDLRMFRGRRRGVTQLLDYLEMASGRTVDKDFRDVVRSAVMFRNCLAHADGLIAESKDARDIRNVLSTEEYLLAGRRGRPLNPNFDDRPRIVAGELGDHLFVPALYAYRLCHDLARLLVPMCIEASE